MVRSGAAAEQVVLYGRHAVLAALANPARIPVRLLASEPTDPALAAAAAARDLSPEPLEPAVIARLAGPDAAHQGMVLVARPLPLADLMAAAETGRTILVLDQVEDARNVGAILRSCAAFGAAALVMQTRHSAPLNGACAKAASGALEWVPVALEVNLARTLDELKAQGYWVAGFAADGDLALSAFRPAQRQVLVLGAEGKGLRPLVRAGCDRLVRIPLAAPVESLNVAVTAGIALCHTASTPPA